MANGSAVQLTSLVLPDLDLRGLDASDYTFLSPTAQVSPSAASLGGLVLTLDRPLDVYGTGPTTTIAFPAGATHDALAVVGDTAIGTYHVVAATVTDTAGHATSYDAGALAAAGISTTFLVGNSATSGDQERPELTDFLSPFNIVTSAAGTSASFGVLSMDVGGSGVASATVTLDRALQTPNGPVSTLQLGPSDGSPHHLGTTISVTSATASGAYHVAAITLTDAAGNSRDYDAADLARVPSFTVDDKTAPVLAALHLPTLDVTDHVSPFPANAIVHDAADNAATLTLTFDKPLVFGGDVGHGLSLYTPSTTVGLVPSYDPSAGDPGSFLSYSDAVPTTRAGSYTVTQAVVTDQAGNSTSYSTADLASLGFDTVLTVKADSIAPVLTGLTLPSFTAGGTTAGTVSVGATDAGSSNGVIYAVVDLDHPIQAPDADRSVYFNQPAQPLLTGPSHSFASGTSGTATVSGDLAESPVYNVTGVALIDKSGNEIDYSAAQLQQMGFATRFVTNSATLFTATPGDETLVAPISGNAYFQGDAGGAGTVVLNGNIGDYTLSRLQPGAGVASEAAQIGAFVLTATNGSGSYTIEQSIGTVRFQNGQYLALHDLPAYVSGTSGLGYGGDGHDMFFQNRSEAYQLFVGGGGSDDVYLGGNARDYVLRHFEADTASSAGAGLPTIHASGLELVARNGSGALLIDDSVETIHFADGQYLSYGDVGAYVGTDARQPNDRLAIAPDLPASTLDFSALPAGERVLLNGDAGDYTLSRPVYQGGDFVLAGPGGAIVLPQGIASVQFADGQYLAPQDLGAYLQGSDVFTSGSPGDDFLKVGRGSDQYVVGGDGFDNLYVLGNTHDYMLASVSRSYDPNSGTPAIEGYELVAKNGSGNIYIDRTVESVHFQNGQYLAFDDLSAYIH
jgi:hypothetical protein